MNKRSISILLTFVLILNMIPQSYAEQKKTNPFSDIQGHWAEDLLIRKYEEGMIEGYDDGTFRPDKIMAKSEAIALINRCFGLKSKEENHFADVDASMWYKEDADIGSFYGYLESDIFDGENSVTKIDIAEMVAGILDLEYDAEENEFSDLSVLTVEQQAMFNKFSEMGYMNGENNDDPERELSRVEIMTFTDDIVGYVVRSQADVVNIPPTGNVTIIGQNIIISNKTIENLYIAPGVNTKTIINNSIIKQKVDVSSEGETVFIDSQVKRIIVKPRVNVATIILEGKTAIKNIEARMQTKIEQNGEDVKLYDVTVKDGNVKFTGVSILNTLVVKSANKVEINNATVNNIIIEKTELKEWEKDENIEKQVVELSIDQDTKISKVVVKTKAGIQGEGKITKAVIESEGVEFALVPEHYNVDKSVKSTIIGMDYIIAKEEKPKSNGSHKKDRTPSRPTNNAPIVVSGEETQMGTATPESNDGTIAVQAYSQDVSPWFSDVEVGDTVMYSVVSADNDTDVSSSVTISDHTLTYIPVASHASKTTTIHVKANDGTDDSASNVIITISVGEIPPNVLMSGSGKIEAPFIIESIEDLLIIGTGENVDGNNYTNRSYYKLGVDLDLTEAGSYDNADALMVVDGDGTAGRIIDELIPNNVDVTLSTNLGFNPIDDFMGIFYGDGKTITNLYINRSTEKYNGLFSQLSSSAKVYNLGIIKGNITGEQFTGGLTGLNGGSINNCYVDGSVTGISNYTGGLVGKNEGAISNSHTIGSVESNAGDLGGLAGSNAKTIVNSYAIESVLSNGDSTVQRVGGFVGYNESWSSIDNSYSLGSVKTIGRSVGGLVGYNKGAVINCYKMGEIEGGSSVGGLIGDNFVTGKLKNSITFATDLNSKVGNIYGRLMYSKRGTLSNNYTNSNMAVYENGSLKDFGTDDGNGVNGKDMTYAGLKGIDATGNPYDQWDFTPDSDNTGVDDATDGYYWVMGADRPVLYWFDGSTGIQVGDDDGRIVVVNKAPIVVSGQEAQIGDARPPSSDNSNIAQLYTQDVSGWFMDIDASGTLTYSVLSANNGSDVSESMTMSGSTLAYTPTKDHASKTTTIIVKANDGTDDSAGNVTITVSVGETPPNVMMLGSGTGETPFVIDSIEDLVIVGTGENADGNNYTNMSYYKLGADLDFTEVGSYDDADALMDADGDGTAGKIIEELTPNNKDNITLSTNLGFYPIGKNTDLFKGSFDGDGKVISNLYINRKDVEGTFGLFLSVVDDQEVSNLSLIGVYITGNADIGGIAGMNYGTVTNCYVEGTINGKNDTGGLVGDNRGIVMNSSMKGNILSDGNHVGGIVGYNKEKVLNCHSSVTIQSNGQSIGGIVGVNDKVVAHTYSDFSIISSGSYIGGIVGLNQDSVSNSYATGSIEGSERVGGIVGYNDNVAKNNIAFNNTLKITKGSYIGRIGGSVPSDLSSVFDTNYALNTMNVMNEEGLKSIIGDNASSLDGKNMMSEDFRNVTSENSPYINWDFTADTDNTGDTADTDGFYWTMGINRPLLHWFDGTSGVQVGSDAGL